MGPETEPGRRWIASLFLLPRCDMHCIFCGSEAGFGVMEPGPAKRLIQELAGEGYRNLVLGGGEPLLWPHDLSDLARTARSLGMFVQLCTNGNKLGEHPHEIQAVDRIILPIESLDPGIHDALRTLPGGHLERVMHAIETVIAAGRELTVSTVVTQRNLTGLDGILDFLADLQRRTSALHAWHLYRFLPIGRAGRLNAADLAIEERVFKDACERLRRTGRDAGFTVYRRDDMVRSRSVAYFWFEKGRMVTGSGQWSHPPASWDGSGSLPIPGG